MGVVGTVGSSRPGRRRKAAETRQLLIDATLRVLTSGAEPSSVNITRAAGISQPAMYAHFKNADECLLAAAQEASERLGRLGSERRKRLSRDPYDMEAMQREFALWLQSTRETGPVLKAFTRFEGDRSALGVAVRAMGEHTSAGVAEDLMGLARRAGVGVEHFPVFHLQAELMMASVAAAGQLLHRGAFPDVELAAETLTRNVAANVANSILACGGDLSRLGARENEEER